MEYGHPLTTWLVEHVITANENDKPDALPNYKSLTPHVNLPKAFDY